MTSASVIRAVVVAPYTSTRSRFAGRVLSVLLDGIVNVISTLSPRRSAVSSPGAAGTLTRGGSGGPFRPHAAKNGDSRMTTVSAEHAELAENINALPAPRAPG